MKIKELLVGADIIESLYEQKTIDFIRPIDSQINSYYVLKSRAGTAVARVTANDTLTLCQSDKNLTFNRVTPRDSAQKAFLDSLADPDILLSIGQGRPGSGKTHLTLAWAFHKLQSDASLRLILTKPNTVVGNTFGFGAVPGDLSEKFKPFLASYEDTLKDLGIKSDYLDKMIERERVEFRPVQYLRGANLRDTILIIDEMQNFTWHELSTILTRVADKSKVVAIGDPSQIDIRLSRNETGFHKLVTSNAFTDSPYTSWVTFEKQYRTALCELVENVNQELRDR
jgi:PhoH-like ATPase